MWRRKVVGDKKKEIKRSRGPCETCPESVRPLLGCPFVGAEGKGKPPAYEHEDSKETRTCAEWFSRQPAILEIAQHLECFKKGRLGDSLMLPAPLLTCLRILEREHENEQRYIDAEALK